MSLQNDVRIDQHGALMPGHDASQFDFALDVMCREEIAEVLDAQVEQSGDTTYRD